MLTCTKLYKDIPFAHRLPNHSGCCRYIHGHNWTFKITFSALKLDKNGFIVDFGNLQYLDGWIKKNLDHACVLNQNDIIINQVNKLNLFKLFTVPNCSCEGLAQYLFNVFDKLIKRFENGRVEIFSIEVFENESNFAYYSKNENKN